jgi:hypothetical protein
MRQKIMFLIDESDGFDSYLRQLLKVELAFGSKIIIIIK